MDKFNLEELEALRDLIDSVGFSVFLKRIENLLEIPKTLILKHNLDSGTEQKLLFLKAQYDGAVKHQLNILNFVQSIKS